MKKLNTTFRGVVYPWHCDHMGHMNLTWYAGKFDEATWNLLSLIGLTATYRYRKGRLKEPLVIVMVSPCWFWSIPDIVPLMPSLLTASIAIVNGESCHDVLYTFVPSEVWIA